MSSRNTTTIRARIAMLIGALSIVSGLVTALYFPASQQKSETRALAHELESIHQLSASLFGPALVFMDIEGANQTASSVLQNEASAFLVVYDELGDVVLSKAQENHKQNLQNLLDFDTPANFTNPGIIYKYGPIQTELGDSGFLAIGYSDASAIALADSARKTSLLIALAFVALGIITAFAVGFTMVAPLTGITDAFVAMSRGSLISELPEVGAKEFVALAAAYNKTASVLREVFEQTAAASTSLGAIVTDVQTDSNNLSRASDTLSLSVGEVGTSVEEIASQIQTVVENTENLSEQIELSASNVRGVQQGSNEMRNNSNALADQISELTSTLEQMLTGIVGMSQEINEWEQQAGGVVEDAHGGQSIIATIISQVEKVLSVLSLIRKEFEELGLEMESVSSVIGSLQGISDRTHILALNASIEAARAGAAGKGFNVVAQEIRKLALQSVSSTHNIEDSIERILEKQRNTRQIVVQNTTQVEADLGEIHTATERLENIVTGVQQILSRTEAISGILGAQESGVESISSSIDNIEQFSQAVRATSTNQYESTTNVMQLMDSLVSMGNTIRNATAEQYNGGQLILRSIQNVDQGAKDANQTAKNLDKAVYALSQQQERLSKATSFFRLTAGEETTWNSEE